MKQKLIYGTITTVALTILIVISCSNTSKSNINSNKITLKWKIEKNDSIVYKTVMTEIGKSKFNMDFGGVFDILNDSLKNESINLSRDFFDKFKKLYNKTDYITILSNSKFFENVVNLKMIAKSKEKNENEEKNEISKMMNSMMKGVMLRGSVNKNGTIHSFWVKNAQKNLISLFFELPNKKISIGDTWTLNNVNLIANDQNFVCKKANKKNVITLANIEKINGETIAVINYDILEYVSGDFNKPAFFGSNTGKIKTTMKFIYKAQAKFSIEKGKWISYNGLMSLDASGFINASQKKKFALIEQ